ncbi:MAG TPA: helix-turn-helix transcriptional regulator [Armatimonadota bacterium]|jgi:DNA-binding CsgD family transcriptional regulator/PAS domain-containing protein
MTALGCSETKLFSGVVFEARNGDILSPELWSETLLPKIAGLTGAEVATLATYHNDDPRLVDAASFGIDDAFHQEYIENYSQNDILPLAAKSSGRLLWRPEDIVSRQSWRDSELCTGLLEPRGYTCMLSALVSLSADIAVCVHLFGGREDACFTEPESRILSLLQPHLFDAFAAARRSQDAVKRRFALEQGFDNLPQPVLVFSLSGEVVHINRRARELLDEDPTIQSAVKRYLGELAMLEAHSPAADRPIDTVMVIADRRYYARVSSAEYSPNERYIAVMLIDPLEHAGIDLRRLTEVQRLSGREIEVCAMIAKGMSNGMIAQSLYISEYTVKDHVKNILRKLDLTRRGQVAPTLLGF